MSRLGIDQGAMFEGSWVYYSRVRGGGMRGHGSRECVMGHVSAFVYDDSPAHQ